MARAKICNRNATRKDKQMVTVFYKDTALFLFEEVAEKIGFKDGDVIEGDGQFWNTLRENALFGVAKCRDELVAK